MFQTIVLIMQAYLKNILMNVKLIMILVTVRIFQKIGMAQKIMKVKRLIFHLPQSTTI